MKERDCNEIYRIMWLLSDQSVSKGIIKNILKKQSQLVKIIPISTLEIESNDHELSLNGEVSPNNSPYVKMKQA